jgi:predicted O-methyltransferase YrrM
MFHHIPELVRERMAYLEALDARDRVDGSPRSARLRQIPPETGRFIALMAAAAPPGQILEIGTSGGYSSLWLGLACQARGARLVTFESAGDKAARARETFAQAGMEKTIHLVHGDAREHLPAYEGIAFCFLDIEKDQYPTCYELVVPRLVPGGLLLADNFTSHADELQPLLEKIHADDRLDALVVPIGKGVLLGRRTNVIARQA